MEEISTTNPEYQPMRVKWRPFMHPRSKTIPLAPIHPFSKQMIATFIVSRITESTLVEIVFPSYLCAPYKGLPSINNILRRCHFFLCSLFLSFSSHTFSWTCRSLREPWKFFSNSLLCIHFFVK